MKNSGILDLRKNPTKFQLNWIRKQNSVRSLDIAVTLKYSQGLWKWYEQVWISEWYHHAKFDIYSIYDMWVNPNVSFWHAKTLWPTKNMLIISLEYKPGSHKTYHALSFLMFVATTTYKLKRTRIQNMQFAVYISDTPGTWKQSLGHKPYNDNVNPKQGYNHAKFQRPCLNGVREKANVIIFLNEKICQLSPLNMCENKK